MYSMEYFWFQVWGLGITEKKKDNSKELNFTQT